MSKTHLLAAIDKRRSAPPVPADRHYLRWRSGVTGIQLESNSNTWCRNLIQLESNHDIQCHNLIQLESNSNTWCHNRIQVESHVDTACRDGIQLESAGYPLAVPRPDSESFAWSELGA
jgi:hypothetical protein